MGREDDRFATFSVVADPIDIGADQSVDDRILRLGDVTFELAYQPTDGLGGSLVPWVVPTSDRSGVFYTMWEDRKDLDQLVPGDFGGIPVIRHVDLQAGTDQEWRRGSYAVAVATDGRVGFVEDLDGAYQFSVPNPNRLMVAVTGGPDQVWSTEEDLRYVTAGWAGDALIAYAMGEGEYLQIFAFDGPRKRRLLSDGGAVGAISPDGSEVLIVETSETGSRFVVERVSDGSVLATLDPNEEGLGSVFSAYGGDWRDDQIVLPSGHQVGGGVEVGMVVLSRQAGSLTLDRLVGLSMPGLTYIPEWLRFTDTGEVWMRVTILGENPNQFIEIECDLQQDFCQTVSKLTDPRMSAIVNNPSRGASQ